MRIVYICSPYRVADEETLHRNIEYARELTREALLRGESPVTVHLYMTQCLNETKSAGARDGSCSRERNNSEMRCSDGRCETWDFSRNESRD